MSVEPTPVIGVPGEPVAVAVVAGDMPVAPMVQDQKTDKSVPATTTFQQDLVTAGQRRINLVWEYTQATIAITVTIITLATCAFLVYQERGSEGAFLLLSNVFFLVVGTYFQRTNHTKTGGVGPHDYGR